VTLRLETGKQVQQTGNVLPYALSTSWEPICGSQASIIHRSLDAKLDGLESFWKR
jgi:hypothetical protein